MKEESTQKKVIAIGKTLRIMNQRIDSQVDGMEKIIEALIKLEDRLIALEKLPQYQSIWGYIKSWFV